MNQFLEISGRHTWDCLPILKVISCRYFVIFSSSQSIFRRDDHTAAQKAAKAQHSLQGSCGNAALHIIVLFLLWLSPVSHTRGHHRTILLMSPSTFMWVPGIEPRSSGSCSKHFDLVNILMPPSPIFPFHRLCVTASPLPTFWSCRSQSTDERRLGKSSRRRQTPEHFQICQPWGECSLSWKMSYMTMTMRTQRPSLL